MTIKEKQNSIDKYMGFATQLKNLSNMKETGIIILVGAFKTEPKRCKRTWRSEEKY